MNVRTRVAPSPTGYPHIGLIRTALYCYALSRKHNGQVILRLEDTDRNRYNPESIDEIFEAFELYGLELDESSKHGGEFGPYAQSERLDLYQKYGNQIVENGFAYYCFLSPEETEKLKEQFRKENVRFRSPFRDTSLEESKSKIEAGEKYVIRLKVPENREIEYEDGLQGKMKFNTSDTSDIVLLKQDGYPTYHLAVAVDDHLMKISHVFRGFEWIPSIPVQVLTYEAFGWEMPEHFHLPVILNPDGKGKLSKRKGTTNAIKFIEDGYLVDALLNFLMLLGWSSPLKVEYGEKEREIFSLEEFVNLFDLEDLNKSNQRFDVEKLNWFNKQYMISTPIEKFTKIFISWCERFKKKEQLVEEIIIDPALDKKLELLKERSATLAELFEGIKFFYQRPEEIDYDIKQLKRINKVEGLREKLAEGLFEIHKSLSADESEWIHEEWEQKIRELGDQHNVKHGDVFMLLRIMIVGAPFSPPMFEALQLLGKEEVLLRHKG